MAASAERERAAGVARSRAARGGFSLLYDERARGYLYQAVSLGGVAFLAYYLFSNASENLARQNIITGFDYLWREASFVISDAVIPYEPSDSYGRALIVGIANTIRVSVFACVLATVIGVAVGIMRLSSNPLLARLMLVYIEALRNTPLLLQLFFWYALIILLPGERQALTILPGVFISNGGLLLPKPVWSPALGYVLAAAAVGAATSWSWWRWTNRKRVTTGRAPPRGPVFMVLLIGLPAFIAAVTQLDPRLEMPALAGFRYAGGVRMTPEFAALLIGLALSASAAIAEIVRSGIQAIEKGQWESALGLGLRRGSVMRLVVLPQALRIIIPPMTSAYLNVTKNSSLAIAIGYPDLVSVSNTTMNQTGQAMEVIAIFMTVYLSLSLLTSLFMNWYNARVALQTR